MKHIVALFLLTIVLTGCAGSVPNPWEQQNNQQAMAGPNGILPGVQPAPPRPGPVQPVPGLTSPGAPQMQPSMAQNLPPVKVALLLPLSGKNADLGQAMLQSAQLALFDMGYKNFELMPEDTKATPEGAKAAAESAIENGAQLLLGPIFSAEVRAVRPIAASHNINVVAFSTDWTQAGGNVFMMGFLPFSQVQQVMEHAVSRGYKRIGIIAPESDYGNAVIAFYNALISRYNLQPGGVARIPAGQKDLQTIIASFSHNNQPDAVLMAVGGEQASAIAALLTSNGMGPERVRRMGTGLWEGSALAQDINLSGAWYAAPQPDLRGPFEKKYWSTYNQAPPRLATLAYDATALAAVLARNGFTNGGQPAYDRASITNPNGFSGIDGIFRFQNNGLVDRGMAVMEMNGGTVTVVEPAPRTFQRPAF